jgi:hypothetical protein
LDPGVTDWSALRDCYGPATEVPALFAAAEPDIHSPIWTDLWGRLCHQGTVYQASFHALPLLAEIAGRWSPTQRLMPLLLAGDIVCSVDQPYGDVDALVSYPAEVAQLHALTKESLADAWESDSYVYLLKALLAFEGEPVWGERLDGVNSAEYEVACPHCDEATFVAFGQWGTFTTQDSMYVRDAVAPRLPLLPADPADLHGIGRRLYLRAIADGHPDVATKLTYVLGRADCPACGKRFPLDDAVAQL